MITPREGMALALSALCISAGATVISMSLYEGYSPGIGVGMFFSICGGVSGGGFLASWTEYSLSAMSWFNRVPSDIHRNPLLNKEKKLQHKEEKPQRNVGQRNGCFP
ncbi:MAG: hypothetical protein AAGG80_03360 [Pseudomonadota bacterium]